ncbi:histone deacetylase HDT1 [Trifolium repens]|nr:histone deacetylase HDT1 [Trifolium repens]
MEFWGVEVKSGESLKVEPEDDRIIHLSLACLGDVTKDKRGEPVSLYVKIDDHKLQLGTLSSEKIPQISYDLVFEKEFELSHNWKYGSVFFTGFKMESVASDDDEDSDDFIEEDNPVNAANGKPEFEVKNGAKPGVNEAQQNRTSDPKKNQKDVENDVSADDEEDSSDSGSDEDSSEDEPMVNGQIESSEDDDDSDSDDEDSDDEETPKKTEGSNKRVAESSKKTPVPVKKAKFDTPEKTGSKNGVHVDTPYPKQAGKSGASNKQPVKQQTPQSTGDYSCKPCKKTFKTEDALGSHNKAKHSAK